MLKTLLCGFVAALTLGVLEARAQNPETLIADAKKEGSVVFYAAYPNAAMQAATVKSFQDKYGIRVDLLQMRASELYERMRAEQAAGRFLGDVLQASDISTLLRVADGSLDKLGTVPNAANLLASRPANEYSAPGFTAAFGIMVNSNLVKPGDEPKSWLELADPKWKGKILADDPRALGAAHTTFGALVALYGEDYHRKLAANGVTFSRDVGSSERRVASGEYPVWIPAATSSLRNLRGLPLRYIAPADGVSYSAMDHSVLKNAPHPNAARLFINHFISAEFQTEIAQFGLLPVIRDMEAHMPAELRPFARARLINGVTPDNQQRMLNLATEIYK